MVIMLNLVPFYTVPVLLGANNKLVSISRLVCPDANEIA